MAVGALCGHSPIQSSPAFATSQSAGVWSGTATTGTLPAPTSIVVLSTSASDVPVTWTGSTGATRYFVTRSDGTNYVPARNSASGALLTTNSCVDHTPSEGTFTYTAVAAYRSWTAVGDPSRPVTITSPTLVAFAVDPVNNYRLCKLRRDIEHPSDISTPGFGTR
ncbi:hypothetical protein RCH22_002286 [Cryobacterium psychrotolerans]|nr:hypothetical protein [Cryobacterium psychrotolerans]